MDGIDKEKYSSGIISFETKVGRYMCFLDLTVDDNL
jgi:hypothetical protein